MPSSTAPISCSREICFSALSWRRAPTKSRLTMASVRCQGCSWRRSKRNVGVTHVAERPFSCAGVYTRERGRLKSRPPRRPRQDGAAQPLRRDQRRRAPRRVAFGVEVVRATEDEHGAVAQGQRMARRSGAPGGPSRDPSVRRRVVQLGRAERLAIREAVAVRPACDEDAAVREHHDLRLGIAASTSRRRRIQTPDAGSNRWTESPVTAPPSPTFPPIGERAAVGQCDELESGLGKTLGACPRVGGGVVDVGGRGRDSSHSRRIRRPGPPAAKADHVVDPGVRRQRMPSSARRTSSDRAVSLVKPPLVSLTTNTASVGQGHAERLSPPEDHQRTIGPRAGVRVEPLRAGERLVGVVEPTDDERRPVRHRTTVAGSLRGLFRLDASFQASPVGS